MMSCRVKHLSDSNVEDEPASITSSAPAMLSTMRDLQLKYPVIYSLNMMFVRESDGGLWR